MISLLEIVGNVSNIVGAIGGIVAAIGTIKMITTQKRGSENVRVALVSGSVTLDLPLEIKRRDCSRGEVLGRIGMLPMRQKGSRFSIRSLSEGSFLKSINSVVEGKTSTLKIIATKEEVEQFDLSPLINRA